MKKSIHSILVLLVLSVFFGCSNDNGESGSSDLIVGKWKQISETENNITQTLTSCDLQEITEFKSNGDFSAEDMDLVDGQCVMNDPSEPGVTVTTKWEKLESNSYRINFYMNGQEVMEISFTTVFSNNNNTMTTTATEADGDVVVSVSSRI